MQILQSFLTLLLFQLAGTLLQTLLHIPIPGPVLGMALLAAWLLARPQHPQLELTRIANGLLAWLGLLFVPAGVGIIANLALLRGAWFPIVVGLLGSTLLTLLVTAAVMHWLERRASPSPISTAAPGQTL